MSFPAGSIEFLTVSVEFCRFVENAREMESSDLKTKLQRLLSLLYFKALMVDLPDFNPHEDDEYEVDDFIDEFAHNNVHSSLHDILGDCDGYVALAPENNDIYDLLAVRIVFRPNDQEAEKDQCWKVYGAVTELYRPHPERIRDWISTPKANGYEALHVTVMGHRGQWVEVQMRPERMDEIAEHGLAAHWKYKTGEHDETSELDKWLQDIKEILAQPDPDALKFLDNFKLNLFAHEVFVFTPSGDIKVLPQGSTALDFAYMVHSELGEHCIGAKVNHKMMPISYQLQSGDQVEVLTASAQLPEREWLNLVTTAKAQNAIRRYFRSRAEMGEKKNMEAYLVNLEMRGADAIGVVMSILSVISDKLHLNMQAVHITAENNCFVCKLELFVFDEPQVEQVCRELRQIPELTEVIRIDEKKEGTLRRIWRKIT